MIISYIQLFADEVFESIFIKEGLSLHLLGECRFARLTIWIILGRSPLALGLGVGKNEEARPQERLVRAAFGDPALGGGETFKLTQYNCILRRFHL